MTRSSSGRAIGRPDRSLQKVPDVLGHILVAGALFEGGDGRGHLPGPGAHGIGARGVRRRGCRIGEGFQVGNPVRVVDVSQVLGDRCREEGQVPRPDLRGGIREIPTGCLQGGPGDSPGLQALRLLDPGRPGCGVVLRGQEGGEATVRFRTLQDDDLGAPVVEALHQCLHLAKLLRTDGADRGEMPAGFRCRIVGQQPGDLCKLQMVLRLFPRGLGGHFSFSSSSGLGPPRAKRTSRNRYSRKAPTKRPTVSVISAGGGGPGRGTSP